MHHVDSREASEKAIYKIYGNQSTMVYTDAASYPGKSATVSTVVYNEHHSSLSRAGSNPPTQAEEVALALVIAH